MPLLPLPAYHNQHVAHRTQQAAPRGPACAPSAQAPLPSCPPDAPACPPEAERAAVRHLPDAEVCHAPRAMQMQRVFVRCANEVAGNVLVSPYAALMGLAPLYAGAGGETARALGQPLGLAEHTDAAQATASLQRLHQRVAQTLAALPSGLPAQSLWIDAAHSLAPGWQAQMQRSRWADVHAVDFTHAPAHAAAQINASQAPAQGPSAPPVITEHDAQASMGGMVLVSSFHVEANWQRPFAREQATTLFTDEAGETRSVRMLRRTHCDAYHEAAHFSAVCVPLADAALQMEFALPHVGKDWRDALLDGRWMSGTLPFSRARRRALALPAFDFDSTLELTQAWRQTDLSVATDPARAHFEPMLAHTDPSPRLHLARMWHKARMRVDAEGTCAAAVTAPAMRPGLSVRAEQASPLRLDRPFLFLMRHTATQEVLFIGKLGLVSALTDAPPNEWDYLSDDEDSAPEDLRWCATQRARAASQGVS